MVNLNGVRILVVLWLSGLTANICRRLGAGAFGVHLKEILLRDVTCLKPETLRFFGLMGAKSFFGLLTWTWTYLSTTSIRVTPYKGSFKGSFKKPA